jgi:hypothetical protein
MFQFRSQTPIAAMKNPTIAVECNLSLVTGYDVVHCALCRFSAAGMTGSPRAEVAGGRKAPRHEIAGSVWQRCRGRYGDFAAGLGLLRLERCSRGARLSLQDCGLRGWKGVGRP